MGIDEQCGLGTFGSNNKEPGGLNQHLNSQDYSSARTFFLFLAASNVCQKIHFIRTRMDRLSDEEKPQHTRGEAVSQHSLQIKTLLAQIM